MELEYYLEKSIMKNNQATDTLNYNDTYLQPEFYRNRLNTANFSNGIYYP